MLLARGVRPRGRCLEFVAVCCVALGAETISLSVKPVVFPSTLRSLMDELKAMQLRIG